jgi:beta-N-acetylhexosaminidase
MSIVKLIDIKMQYIIFVIIFATIFISCEKKNLPEIVQEKNESPPIVLLSDEEILAHEIIDSMSDAELAAQVLMTGIDGDEHLSSGMVELLQKTPAGAVMLFKYNLTGDTETIKNLLKETASYIKESGKNIPPFIAVDHEGGLVHRFGGGLTRLPAARLYWEKAQSGDRKAVLEMLNADAFSSGNELAALGINMNLAPVAEIENDENILFLDTRSYGPDSDFVSDAVSSFSDGMMRSGVLPVLKHFPGSSSTDPHLGIAVMEQSREELAAMIMPFQKSIQNGKARAMMISHSIVSAIDPDKNGSLSNPIIQDWLRTDLGFNGIIIADDFSMQAVTSRGIQAEDAIIEALNAGINIVMVWPKDLQKNTTAILSALDNGTLSRETLASRAEIILLEKIKLGVIPYETIN